MNHNSAIRDEWVFVDPYRSAITREPNPAQISFGAGGPRSCLGANLARSEMTVMFDTIRQRLPSLQIMGATNHVRSGFIDGIERLQRVWD